MCDGKRELCWFRAQPKGAGRCYPQYSGFPGCVGAGQSPKLPVKLMLEHPLFGVILQLALQLHASVIKILGVPLKFQGNVIF